MDPCSRLESREPAVASPALAGSPAPGRAASPAPRAAPRPPQPAGPLRGERTAGPGFSPAQRSAALDPRLPPPPEALLAEDALPERARNRSPRLRWRGLRSSSMSAAVAVAETWHLLPGPGLPSRLKGAPQGTYPRVRESPLWPALRARRKGEGCWVVVMVNRSEPQVGTKNSLLRVFANAVPCTEVGWGSGNQPKDGWYSKR